MKKVTLFSLALPILGELALFVLLGFIDVMMLTKVSDQAAGAVGATNQIISIINIVFSLISAGTGVLISQFMGANKEAEGHKVIVVSFLAVAILGIICSIILLVFGQRILILIGVSPGLMSYAHTYIKIVGGFMFVQSILNVGTVTMRTYGYTKQTLSITALMNILNVVGDAIFIFGLFGLPKLGVAGVAIATSASRSIAVIITLIYIFRTILPVSSIKYLKTFPHRILRKLLAIGIPSALSFVSYQLSQLVLASFILRNLGETMYITRTYIVTMSSIVVIFAMAIGQANQILVGRLVGEKRLEEAYKTCLQNFKISFFISIIIGSSFYFFGQNYMQLFTDNKEIILWGTATAMINAFLEPGRTFNIVVTAGLRGAGDVVTPVIIVVIVTWLVSVGGGYFFGIMLKWGLPGIWFGSLLDEWIRGFAMYLRWRSKKWTSKLVI